MAEPWSNLRDKLDRAVIAHLISQGAVDAGAVYPAMFSGDKKVPNITVVARSGRREVALTGIYRFQVQIIATAAARVQPAETNPDAPRMAANAMLARAVDALTRSGDDQTFRATAQEINAAGRALAVSDGSAEGDRRAAANADMVDFTVTGWYDVGPDAGHPEDESSAWSEIMVFEAVCCAQNVD